MDNVDQETRWLHNDAELLSKNGVRYQVIYLGSVEVLSSMKALDFENRTKVARDSIRLVCVGLGIQINEIQKSKENSSGNSLISNQPNLTHQRTRVELIINTEALTLKRASTTEILCSHRLEGISFASAGEHETKDYIAYVAKDNQNQRACHVLRCQNNESLDVITTIGQAFELRYNEYIKAQQQANEQPELSKPIPRARFDDEPNLSDDLSTNNKWNSMKSSDIYQEDWFHGKINREETEALLRFPGDFLIRESTKVAGQFILSGRTKTHHKHLLLVDPDGVIRTRDYEFDSIQHLIAYHQSGNIPIVSADSELLLETPIFRRH